MKIFTIIVSYSTDGLKFYAKGAKKKGIQVEERNLGAISNH